MFSLSSSSLSSDNLPKLWGISPENRFSDKSKFWSLSLPNEPGNSPKSLFFAKFSISSDGISHLSPSILPERLFPEISKKYTSGSFVNSEDNSPERRLFWIRTRRKLLQELKLLGISPWREFEKRMSLKSRPELHTLLGIFPTRELEERSSIVRLFHLPRSSGILPDNLFDHSWRTWSLGREVKAAGIFPVKLLEKR
ncbi:hypothetical protein CIPAW_08G026600 [Carya illinoinensis]|uniref:Uncharacterized protein n=1 Tax=Carya illinoinensis TaxID=32201 RepID=A0A8T1PPE4_CARIL|nr:hypothetical protein CIPAW_08G026600 [Carya illinoinensis]